MVSKQIEDETGCGICWQHSHKVLLQLQPLLSSYKILNKFLNICFYL